MTKEFKFSLTEKIIIKEIQRPARIDLIQISSLGIEYRVVVWDNSERKAVWVYEDEIESRP